jgi:hypothetical protein
MQEDEHACYELNKYVGSTMHMQCMHTRSVQSTTHHWHALKLLKIAVLETEHMMVHGKLHRHSYTKFFHPHPSILFNSGTGPQ